MDWLALLLTLLLGFTVGEAAQSEGGGTSAAPDGAEMRTARAIVNNQVGPDDDVESASYVLRRGKVGHANTGEPCMSGRLIKVKIIGTFPHIVTTGDPWTSEEDSDVHAVLVTADARTGTPCQIGVQTGDPKPLRGAIGIPLE
jgi:hypothetical protein